MNHAGRLSLLVGSQLGLGAELHPPLSSCCPTAVGARQDASPLVLFPVGVAFPKGYLTGGAGLLYCFTAAPEKDDTYFVSAHLRSHAG